MYLGAILNPPKPHLAKEAVLDRIPLRGPCRIVRHRHAQPEAIRELLLELTLPVARSVPITAPGVSQDEQLGRVAIARSPMVLPPLRDCIDGKLGRVCRAPHVEIAEVGADIVDTVGHGPGEGITGKIMHVDRRGLMTPPLARLGEEADEFFVFGIDADDRPAHTLKKGALGFDIAKLAIPVGMRLRHQAFDVRFRADLVFVQEAPDRLAREPIPGFVQAPLEARQAATGPPPAGLGVASDLGFDELKHGRLHLFFGWLADPLRRGAPGLWGGRLSRPRVRLARVGWFFHRVR